MPWPLTRHNDATSANGSSGTPFSSQLVAQTGIWKGRPFRCRFQWLPVHWSIGEIKNASSSSSYTSGPTPQVGKFHLCIHFSTSPAVSFDIQEYTRQSYRTLPDIRLTRESFLTGVEACSDERHNHGRSDDGSHGLPGLKTPPPDSLPACR